MSRSGRKAVAAGVCVNLRIDDRLTSNHRGHGHALAKGADPKRMMLELYGRDGGYCRGKGGSMHIADFSVGMLGANGVVAGGIPIAVGAAQGLKMQKSDAIATCMFGDGAINRGPFLEGLNWAVLFKLPVLFVCEDNGVAAFTRAEQRDGRAGRARARQGARRRGDHGRRQQRDGGGRCGADCGRGGPARGGAAPPACATYRITGHTSTDAAAWRPAGEVEEARSRDPIARLGAMLAERGIAASDLGKIIDEAKAEMAQARDAGQCCSVARGPCGLRGRAGYGGGCVVEVTLIEARVAPRCRRCGATSASGCSARTSRAAACGASTGTSSASSAPERVVSTPISESTIMGAGLGSALVGMRPIIEMRIFDFVMCAMDELVNQIAKIRYMFGGQAKPAVVVRMPHGMWRNSAAQHSQMLEAWFAHLPGVIVVTPSTAEDTAGLLVQAIRSDDPVLFFDPKDLFGVPGDIADPIEPIPFGVARKAAEGDAATVVSWSAAMPVATKGAEMLAADGIKVDLLDLRTIWPWDQQAVIDSVKKTGRLLVVHEAVEVAGFGAEIVATVVDRLGPAGDQGRQAPRRAAHSDPVRAAAGGGSARDAREGRRRRESADRRIARIFVKCAGLSASRKTGTAG